MRWARWKCSTIVEYHQVPALGQTHSPRPQGVRRLMGEWTGKEAFTLRSDEGVNAGAQEILTGGLPNLEGFLEDIAAGTKSPTG